MNADAAVAAVKSLHVPHNFTFLRDNFASPTGYQDYQLQGCRSCGGRSPESTFWPCPTAAILAVVEP